MSPRSLSEGQMQDFLVAETPSSQRTGRAVWIPDQGTRPHRLQPRVYMWQQDPVHVCVISPVSHVTLHDPREAMQTATWTVAHQAPLSVGFSRQEYWSGLPCPPAVDLPNPGIKPTPLVIPA